MLLFQIVLPWCTVTEFKLFHRLFNLWISKVWVKFKSVMEVSLESLEQQQPSTMEKSLHQISPK